MQQCKVNIQQTSTRRCHKRSTSRGTRKDQTEHQERCRKTPLEDSLSTVKLANFGCPCRRVRFAKKHNQRPQTEHQRDQRFCKTEHQQVQSFVLSDWTCWCSVLAKLLVSLVLRLWSLIVLFGASFVLSDWACWCSVLAKPLVSLVLRLWSLIVLSGASFVLSDWTCWCSVLAKPLVSLVLRLWSLIVLSGASFVLSNCGL